MRVRRLLLSLFVCAGVSAVAASEAGAAVSVSTFNSLVSASGGSESDGLTVTSTASSVTFSVPTGVISTFDNANRCTTAPAPTVLCASNGQPLQVTIDLGGGADVLSLPSPLVYTTGQPLTLGGGSGTDLLDLSGRAAATTADVGTVDSSGLANFESVTGGSQGDTLTNFPDTTTGGGGNDTLTGTGGNNVVDGGEGQDTLTGAAGNDTLIGGGATDIFDGGEDDDTLRSADGIAETANCGNGTDVNEADTLDQQVSCETRTLPPPPAVGGGGGGSAAGGGTGGGSVPRPTTAAPKPVRIKAKVSRDLLVRRRYTVIRKLDLGSVPAGATVTALCTNPKRAKGRPCAFKRKRFAPRRGKSSLGKAFKARRLPVGTVVEIRVSASNAIGQVVRLVVRAGKSPTSSTLCLPPDAKTPKRC